MLVELVERFGEASRHDGFKARDFLFERRSGGADHAGQAQNGSEIGFRLARRIASRRSFNGLQIGRRDFLIHCQRPAGPASS